MELTLVGNSPFVDGDRKASIFELAFGSSYPFGGESLTVRDLGFALSTDLVDIPPFGGYLFEYDYANAKVRVRDRTGTVVTHIKDDDNAATAGVAVYVHVDEVLEQGSALAHLEFVSPTNADGTGTLVNGGPTYYIQDDDNAATGGVALYLDEDATPGSRLLANVGRDCFVQVGNGNYVKVTHNATPATPGKQVYFDEDAANTYDRLRFVSPTNADGSETSSGEVVNATTLAGLTGVRGIAWGR